MLRFKLAAGLMIVCVILWGCTEQTSAPSPAEEPEGTGSPPARQVGMNVNGQFNLMKFENLDRSGTIWVRGFLDFFQLYPDEDNLENDQRVQNYLKLKDQGYKTILNIKWNFHGKSFPEPDSPEMENYKSYLRKLLHKVWTKTDIIVSGNEPFIESKKDERGEKLVAFYKEMTREIHRFRENSDREILIFVGAFNNLYLDGWRTASVNEMFAFADGESWIEGVDLHIHHANTEQVREFIDYATLRIRRNQKILITEFSLMKHFRNKMRESIPGGFAEKYGWDPATQNYQYLDYALKNQVPHGEWVDFLSNSYWFENRKRYLWNMYELFKSYDKFHVATYALRQSYPFDKDFTSGTAPWILNGIFANRTVHKDPDTGQDQFNYAWIDVFTEIQKDPQK